MSVDARQEQLFGAQAAATAQNDQGGSAVEGSWEFDALVLYAGLGGAALGLTSAGCRAVGVEPDADMAAAHVENAGACIHADPLAWEPPGTAKLVFVAQPAELPRSEAVREALDPSIKFSVADLARLEASWPRRRRLARAVEIAVACCAEVIILEVSGGKRGDPTDAAWLHARLARAGYSTETLRVDPLYLGVASTRPTTLVVAFQGTPKEDRALRRPTPTHGPVGNLAGLRPFVSVREALGLRGSYRHSDNPDKVTQGALNVSAPAPTFGPSGAAASFYPAELVEVPVVVPDEGQPPEVLARLRAAAEGMTVKQPAPPVKLDAPQIAALLGLPASATMGGKKGHRHQAATVFPPALAAAVARCVFDYVPSAAPKPAVAPKSPATNEACGVAR